MFRCTCTETFDNKIGLGLHRLACTIYNAEDSDDDDNDNAAAQEEINERFQRLRENKRLKLLPPPPDPPTKATSSTDHVHEPEAPPPDDPMQIDDPPQLSPPREPSPEPEVAPSGRPVRTKRLTWKLLQQLPEPPAVAPELVITEPDPDATPPPAPTSFVWESIKGAMNTFGLYREYPRVPTHDPDGTLSLNDLSDIPKPPSAPSSSSNASPSVILPSPLVPTAENKDNPYYPFPNSTAYGITNWMWSGSPLKSIQEVTKLVEFLKSDAFRKEDLACFNLVQETERLDKYNAERGGASASGSGALARDGWSEVSVSIKVPDGKPHSAASPIPLYTVPGLFLRPLSEVIKSAIQDTMSRHFHFTPFKQFHKSDPDAIPTRVFDEIYSSDAMIEAYEEVNSQPGEPGCELERVVLGLMFWSDSTHLASFGTASLWPLYLFFGNQSKWVRGKPRSGACHHLAYIPKLPDDFHDFYTTLTGKGPSADVLAHCRRELMHGVWEKILDDDFMKAYEHGIVLQCHDGVSRRFYPRVFTYSADYPEKVLLAGIRNLGTCPCPRCKINKDNISNLGTKLDDRNRTKAAREDTPVYRRWIEAARRRIYEFGDAIKSKRVEAMLSSESFVPTLNTFSERFSKFGFNFYRMLVPDFLHEVELGVFKSLFSHLIRILIAHGGSSVHELNRRYRMVPPFGRAVIRRFVGNASAMKKMAARNFEDVLQCAIPVFEGLLPEAHNQVVLGLLFTFCEWHALAKLRMHTSPLVNRLSTATTELGRQLRYFVKHVCPRYDTRELPNEEAARGRRKARKSKTKQTPVPRRRAAAGPANAKQMNLNTYKLHSLGDYVRYITLFGTSDSYSTQTGELEHRRVKRFYARTNKNTAVRQMTVLERREQALLRIERKLGQILPALPEPPRKAQKKGKRKHRLQKRKPYVDFAEAESLPYTAPEQHHHISNSRNFYINIAQFLHENEGDPAIHNFVPKLKDHLLSRLSHPDWSGDGHEFTPEQHRLLLISNNRIYRHKVLRVNYTTYDVRRGQDSMNPRTRSDIMTLAPEGDTSHPFSYSRILGVFHIDAVNNIPGASTTPTSIEVLWVRHFRRDVSFRAGFKAKRLHRLEFLPGDHPDAFGFLNPDEVIRGAHLIPAFHYGRTQDLLEGHSLALDHEEFDDDAEWRYHYVNMFVDRDMFMRYVGGGIGHYQVKIAGEVELPTERHAMGLDEEDESEPAVARSPEHPGPGSAASAQAATAGRDARPGEGSGETEPSETPTRSPPESDSDSDKDSTFNHSQSSKSDKDSAGSGDGGSDANSSAEDLGAEDGEDYVDEEDEEGYAPL